MKKMYLLMLNFILIISYSANSQNQEQDFPKGKFTDAVEVNRSDHFFDKISNAQKSRLYYENFKTGYEAWTTVGDWQIGKSEYEQSQQFKSPVFASTSIQGSYKNNADDWLISPEIYLPGDPGLIMLKYDEWFELETNYDFGIVKVSTDNGKNWTQVSYSTGVSDLRETIVDLTTFKNNSVLIGFQFLSDDSVNGKGWHINNIRIDLFDDNTKDSSLSGHINSLNVQNFPLVYSNVTVNIPDNSVLDQSNFQVYEDGVLQTNLFNVIPPETGGGQRLADIIIVLDVTGSMGPYIDAVKSNLLSFINALGESDINYNVGFVTFGDIVYVYNSYNLYDDLDEILSVANAITLGEHGIGSGGDWPENQLGAMAEAAQFNWRPGTERIQIMITDAPSHENNDVTPWTVESLINDMLLPNNITVFPVFNTSCSPSAAQYIPIAEATNPNGTYFHIYDNFNDILEEIGEAIGNTYIVRYYSSNPDCDGIERDVEIFVSHGGETIILSQSYIPCQEPYIERTPATVALHNQSWAENTNFTLQVHVFDPVEPYVNDVKLFYRVTGAADYNFINMNYLGDNLWSANVPTSSVLSPGLDYYFTATDGILTVSDPKSSPSVFPYQIAILPNVAPVIDHTPVVTLNVGEPIVIEALIMDETNFLAAQKLYYRKAGQILYQSVDMTLAGGDLYSAIIPADYVTADGVHYYISAWDNFGLRTDHGTWSNPHIVGGLSDLQPPTDLTASLDEENGEVELNWNFATGEGFYEDFTDGVANNWVPRTGNWHVAGNTYNGISATPHEWTSSYYNQDFSNFIYEAKIRKSQGMTTANNSIFFNGNPSSKTSDKTWHNEIGFGYNANGSWLAWVSISESEWYFLQEWTNSPHLNTGLGQWNVLKAVVVDGYMDLYINNILHGTFYDDALLSGKVGLNMFDDTFNGVLEVDYVSVVPLTKDYTFGKVEYSPIRNILEGNGYYCYEFHENPTVVATKRAPVPIHGMEYTYNANNHASNERSNFLYFKVYRDGVYIGNTSETTYTDHLPGAGSYQYTVTAFYDEGESEPAGPVTVLYNQLCEALDNCDLTYTTGGHADWFPQTEVTYDGIDAAQSGNITHNQQSWFETTVTGPGELSFYWKVSSESSYDYLNFFINGTRMNRISGSIDWHIQEYSLGEGNHTLRWSYTKDASVSHGQDCGWVDQLSYTTFSNENIMLIRDATAPINGVVTIELEIINQDEFVGFNADIPIPSGFTYVPGSAQLHRDDGHFFNFEIIAGNVARMLSAAIPTTPFLGNDGVIVSFDLQTPSIVGIHNFCVVGAVIADEDGVNIMTNDFCGTITLEESSTVTFNVTNYLGSEINNAIITFAGVENPAGNYVFDNIEAGTHFYTVEKDCYLIADGFVTVDQPNVTVNVVLENVLGDANNDGAVNVSDVVIISNFFMGQNPDPFCFINADVNGDGVINVSDVVGATNIFMGGKISPHQGLKSEQASAYLFQDGIYLDSDGTLTAMQLEITGYNLENLSLALNLPTHQLIYRVVDNKLIAMVFSISNAPIPEGRVRIIDFEPDENMLQWGEVLVANLNAELVDVETRTDEATDVQEIEGLENIQVYPNPAKDVLWVEFVNNSTQPMIISLINIHGQLIQYQVIHDTGQIKTSIDIKELPAGTFILKIESNYSSITKKIIIR